MDVRTPLKDITQPPRYSVGSTWQRPDLRYIPSDAEIKENMLIYNEFYKISQYHNIILDEVDQIYPSCHLHNFPRVDIGSKKIFQAVVDFSRAVRNIFVDLHEKLLHPRFIIQQPILLGYTYEIEGSITALYKFCVTWRESWLGVSHVAEDFLQEGMERFAMIETIVVDLRKIIRKVSQNPDSIVGRAPKPRFKAVGLYLVK